MTALSPTPSADAAAVGPRRSVRALTLLDVLIGMAVFALIAVIAVIALGAYRERAFETGAQSDARSVGVALESNYVKAQGYPATMTSANLAAMNLTLTKNNQISEYQADHEGVSFCVSHYSGTNADAWARWDSQEGGVVSSGRGPSCGAGGSTGGSTGGSSTGYTAGTNPAVPCPEIVSATHSRQGWGAPGYPRDGYYIEVTFAEPANTALDYPFRATRLNYADGFVESGQAWTATSDPKTRIMRLGGLTEGNSYKVHIAAVTKYTYNNAKGCTQHLEYTLPNPMPIGSTKYPVSVVTGPPWNYPWGS